MIQLRSFRTDDLNALVSLADNPNVARFMRDIFPSPYTREDGRWWITQGQFLTGSAFAIEYDRQLVGGCGLTPDTEDRAQAEVGYWLGEPYWGKGMASTALQELVQFAFSARNFTKLYAGVVQPNVASMRVLEKCGFYRETVAPAAMTLRGITYDEHVFVKQRD